MRENKMSVIYPTAKAPQFNNVPFNWPVVTFLLLMTAIPGVPAIFIVTLVALGPSVDGNISSVVNAVYFETPAAILVHGSSGVLFFLTMPFQFSPALRMKYANWHKVGGRIALLSGYVMAISGVWMHHVLSPNSVDMRYFSLVIMSAAMCATFSLALWHIVNGNIQKHRQWMIRAVAITLGAITPLFVGAIISVLFGQFDTLFATLSKFQYDFGRLVGMGINLIVVEFVFWSKGRKR